MEGARKRLRERGRALIGRSARRAFAPSAPTTSVRKSLRANAAPRPRPSRLPRATVAEVWRMRVMRHIPPALRRSTTARNPPGQGLVPQKTWRPPREIDAKRRPECFSGCELPSRAWSPTLAKALGAVDLGTMSRRAHSLAVYRTHNRLRGPTACTTAGARGMFPSVGSATWTHPRMSLSSKKRPLIWSSAVLRSSLILHVWRRRCCVPRGATRRVPLCVWPALSPRNQRRPSLRSCRPRPGASTPHPNRA